MEGVTEPCFRALVLERNGPEALGGAFTEFARVVDTPLPVWKLREHLGQRRFPQPVGLQLMGSNAAALAETARRAFEAGAPLVDLNFGCPAKGALRGCAGSALLRDPRQLEQLARTVVQAVASRPVTAKLRAGYDDASRVEDLARAAEQSGVVQLTLHCRTRADGYCESVDWSRIARAVSAVSIPVCGNGGARTLADAIHMRDSTGCRAVMIGHGALVDPWVFSGGLPPLRAREAAGFLREYALALQHSGGATPRGTVARVKQLVRVWTAGGLFARDRAAWLGETDPRRFLERLDALAQPQDSLCLETP
jgi:tRNA-dihydrouridine synthase C